MSDIERFSENGYALIEHVFPRHGIDAIAEEVLGLPVLGAGMRNLLSFDWCHALALHLAAEPFLQLLDPKAVVPVQCTYFEKSSDKNWLVAAHQDLSIPVVERIEHPELRGWSRKDGMWFVQAPVEVMNRMLVLRLHLDFCGPDDGPLRVVPGSHTAGRLSDEQALRLRDEIGEETCHADRGDILAMRPLLLHASSKSRGAGKRRVLHFLFGPAELPLGLAWP
ncbi:MAG TPA: phytanoyl-CoA dioxygenase family protein [Burkholderiaceae bacterium]